uniref:Asteroid domain-containing protein n=1 Tax=Poecilia reticulata TaxID=8081 RepID=A0A3P9PUL9_POERE
MGVTGMKTLVAESDILEDVGFKDSAVIIDGPSLYYSLYFNSKPKLDQQHGGDYSAFRDLVCQFFSSLKSCNVKPLVLLDGGAEPVKNKTVGNRLKDKLQKAKKLSESMAGERDNILPPLVKDVFIQVLQELQVEIQQCFGEADLTAALRANERKCPVLSNDSDFYIFNVQEGFLSIDGFQWETVTQGAIPAQRYRVSQFCRCFNVDEDHMPVFAALSGNDYSYLGKEDGKKFIEKYPEAQQPGGSFTPSKGASKDGSLTAQQYVLKEPPRPNLPQWVIQEIQRASLTSFVTSVVTQKSMTLTPLVEDFSQPSSYSASLRIRQFFYGLLLGTEPCTEYDREGAEDMRPKQVTPVLAGVTPEELQKLELEHLNELVVNCYVGVHDQKEELGKKGGGRIWGCTNMSQDPVNEQEVKQSNVSKSLSLFICIICIFVN